MGLDLAEVVYLQQVAWTEVARSHVGMRDSAAAYAIDCVISLLPWMCATQMINVHV